MDINGQDECVQSNPSGRARPPLTLSVLGGTVSPRLQDSNLTVAGGNVTYAFTSHFHSHYSPSRTRSNPNSSERRRESQRPLTARLGTSMRRLFTSRNNSHPERNTVSRDDGIEAPVIDIGATGDSDEGIGSSISSSGGASEREGFSVISLHEDNADELVPPSLRRVQRAGPTVYARQMINELGFPLWMPKPSSLPDNRVEQGITPGDVGVFTDDGGFCYLFNIWSDKDALRDIDVPGLREFVPPPERMVQVSNDIIREMGTLSEGAEVKRIYPQGLPRRYCDFRFEWSKAEGAVMVVPFGALSESLTDRTALEPFIKHNCQRLYQLARTKGIFKASLYLVTGTVKSGSWAIAAHCAQTAPTPPFPSAELHNETRGSESLDGYAYQWAAHSSGTKAHTGPEYLASGSDSKNQCLFIRGYRLTMCSDGAPSSGQSSSDVASTPSASPVASHVPNVPSISGSSLSASESRQADTAPHPPEGHNLQRSYMLKLYPVTSPDNYPPDYLNHLIRSFAKNNLYSPHPTETLPFPMFSMLHDDLWLRNWKGFEASHVVSEPTRSQVVKMTMLQCVRAMHETTRATYQHEYPDIISLEPSTSPRQQSKFRSNWNLLFSGHVCSKRQSCFYHMAHLAVIFPELGEIQELLSIFDNLWSTTKQFMQRSMSDLSSDELARVLRISTSTTPCACSTVAVHALGELEARGVPSKQLKELYAKAGLLKQDWEPPFSQSGLEYKLIARVTEIQNQFGSEASSIARYDATPPTIVKKKSLLTLGSGPLGPSYLHARKQPIGSNGTGPWPDSWKADISFFDPAHHHLPFRAALHLRMDIGIKHTEHLLLTDPGHILRSSGKYPSTHRGVAGTLESRFHPVPLQYSCMFMCIGGVDLAILLRETRSALIERMFSNLPVCANTLIEEHWRASICGPKNEVYHVFIVYSGKAAQSTTSDPRQPVGLDQAKGIPGIMSVVRRNDI